MSTTSGFKIIAIDGGAATGKSSTSQALASRLGLMHVDTGAHYRTLTFALLKEGAFPEQTDALPPLLETLEIGTQLVEQRAFLSVNGIVPDDVDIRSPEVNAAVSKFAALKPLRDFLFQYQRSQSEVAETNEFAGLVMEGRDIGSVIFPDADFRFFLFADEATRAARRAKDGQTDSIQSRDKMDSTRKTAPMVCPEGAIRIDTGPLPLEGVVDKIASIIKADNV